MKYTYDEFLKNAADSGMNFSDDDMRLAEQNPDAGMSILTYKQDYANAQTDTAKAMAHANAEDIRRRYGSYAGGTDGSGYALTDYENPYVGQYDETIKGALSGMQKEFSWSPETDPNTKYYTDAYRREGNRAMQDTLGQVAARTGGNASTYAVGAAAQANNYYMQQLADKYPELYQQAYSNYLSEIDRQRSILDEARGLDESDYAKFIQDRNYGYQKERDIVSDRQQQWQNEMTERELDADIEYRMQSLSQSEQQAVDELAYKYAALYQNGQQADADLQYKYAALSQDAQQIVNELAYKYAALDADTAYRTASLEQAQREADMDNAYRYASLNADTAYKNAALAQSQREADMENAYKYAALAENGRETDADIAYKLAVLDGKNIDYSNLESQIAFAEWAAQMGDYSKLEALGIDPELYRAYVAGLNGGGKDDLLELYRNSEGNQMNQMNFLTDSPKEEENPMTAITNGTVMQQSTRGKKNLR